jgi:hypothetical protein
VIVPLFAFLSAGTFFGWSTSLLGTTIAIGAQQKDINGNSNLGETYIFKKNGSSWSETQKITGTTSETSPGFGWSVALADNANTLLVGAPFFSTNLLTQPPGSVSVFNLNTTTPSCIPWISLSCSNDGSCGTSNYQVKVNKDSGLFSGYAWGGAPSSGGTGWIDFSGATANLVTSFPGCAYLPPQYGRTLMQFSDTSILSPSVASRNPTTSKAIKAGSYKITLATFDNHSSLDGETNESWYQDFFIPFLGQVATPPSADLPDYASYAEYKVSDFFAFERDTSAISATFPARSSLPRNSTFTPACVAYDYVCPLPPQEGRTIVTFTDPSSSNPIPLGMPVTPGIVSQPFTMNVPVGTYNVTLASYDNHSAQSSPLPSVGWHLKFLNGGTILGQTLASETLPVGDDFLITDVGTVEIKQPVLSGSTVGETGPGTKSVTALCAAFDKIEKPTVTLLTTPPQMGTPPEATINYGNTGSIHWTITGNYDQCTFDSTIPPSAEHTAWNDLSDTLQNPTGTFAAVYPPTGGIQGDYDYTLMCSYNGTESDVASVKFKLNPASPLSVILTPTYQSVVAGNNATDDAFFDWNIVGDMSGGCIASSSDAPSWNDATWVGAFASILNDPRTGRMNVNNVAANSIYTFNLECKDGVGNTVRATSIVSSRTQCSDTLDNDNDGEADRADPGCWTDSRAPLTYQATDDAESGEKTCVVDNICQVKYGENPFTCPADCKIQKYKDQ